ncbi:unnamed protein product, partial [Iphiclides podalirius]
MDKLVWRPLGGSRQRPSRALDRCNAAQSALPEQHVLTRGVRRGVSVAVIARRPPTTAWMRGGRARVESLPRALYEAREANCRT